MMPRIESLGFLTSARKDLKHSAISKLGSFLYSHNDPATLLLPLVVSALI